MTTLLRRIFPLKSSFLRLYSTKKLITEKESLLTSINKQSIYFWMDYFSFSHECRVNGKKPREVLSPGELSCLTEAIKSNPELLTKSASYFGDCSWSSHVRSARSGVEFLYEDMVKNEDSLRLPWRQFFHLDGGDLYDMEEKLHTHYPNVVLPEYGDVDDVDIRAVPSSHNWWTDEDKYDSEMTFGKRIIQDDDSHMPIIPAIAVKKQQEQFDEAMYTFQNLSEGPKILSTYFDFSKECRRYKTHPLTTYEYSQFSADSVTAVVNHLDDILLNGNFKMFCPRKALSAVDFMGKEIIPNLKEAQETWKTFLQGNGIRKLEMIIRQKPMNVSDWDMDLSNIPSSHWWWRKKKLSKEDEECYSDFSAEVLGRSVAEIVSNEDEADDGSSNYQESMGLGPLSSSQCWDKENEPNRDYKIPNFKTYFLPDLEIVLCSMDRIYSAKMDEKMIKKVDDFLYSYFNLAKSCRRHSKSICGLISFSGKQEEFLQYLPTVITSMDKSLQFVAISGNRVKAMRSAIEFLKEDLLPILETPVKEKWEEFLGGEGMKTLIGKANFACENRNTAPDLRAVPESHYWWTKREITELVSEHGSFTEELDQDLKHNVLSSTTLPPWFRITTRPLTITSAAFVFCNQYPYF